MKIGLPDAAIVRPMAFFALFTLLGLYPTAGIAGTTEFCLNGEYNLGARYQGLQPIADEFYPATWCVVTDESSSRVLFAATGKTNPDMDGDWMVAYLPPDLVRIVNRDAPPDIEFHATDNPEEAKRIRRIDPRRLLEELKSDSEMPNHLTVRATADRIDRVQTHAVVALRGDVEVSWNWNWSVPANPALQLIVDDRLLFEATGRWRNVPDEEAEQLWRATPGADPIELPGDRWPSRSSMRLINITDNVYVVRGVRTGFQHMVVEIDEGLVVADAPSGWVEFHHLPPADLMPGLGVSGLSEQLIEFLGREFEGRKIRAVALTHDHDDHAGGASAFAKIGADVYAPAKIAEFLEEGLTRSARDSGSRDRTMVLPVDGSVTIGGEKNRVKLLTMGPNPHSGAMLGVWAVDQGYFFVSDIHVPRSDADAPRAQRVVSECWFARWAVRHLPDDVRVLNSHSEPATPVSRLKRYLESPLCH